MSNDGSRIIVLGGQGYIGWALTTELVARGHHVCGVDDFSRRQRVRATGADSIIPTLDVDTRAEALRGPGTYYFEERRVEDGLEDLLSELQPDAIVHLAEQPSAPYSMRSWEACRDTCTRNTESTLRLLWDLQATGLAETCHLVKLGTMGEYGTPGVPIPEGYFPASSGQLEGLPFPRRPGSFYHASKVADTVYLDFAARMWGLRATDVMQGVVYGTQVDAMHDDPSLATRYDVDESFGTAVNRFCAQAIVGHPLTVYGLGGQTRGYLPLRDSVTCLCLLLDNPADQGAVRVVNQLDRTYSVVELAQAVRHVAAARGHAATVQRVDNPRKEAEEHTYEVATDTLRDLGYRPTANLEGELHLMLRDLEPHIDQVRAFEDRLMPSTRWDPSEGHRRSRPLELYTV